MMGDVVAAVLWLLFVAFAVYLVGWSMNLWAALGWQGWSL